MIFFMMPGTGPPTEAPGTLGFGLRLVQGLIEHELGGEVTFDFEREGLQLRLCVPMVGQHVQEELQLAHPVS